MVHARLFRRSLSIFAGATDGLSSVCSVFFRFIPVILLLINPIEAYGEERALDTALAAYARGELDSALESFEDALRSGEYRTADLVTIHTHLGVLRGATGDHENARRSFEVALSLNPLLPVPAELGGNLRTLFQELLEARNGLTLDVVIESNQFSSEQSLSGHPVETRVLNAPPGLVTRLAVEARSPGEQDVRWRRYIESAGPVTFTVPSETWGEEETLVLVVDAFDEYGGYLARGELELSRRISDRGVSTGNDDDEGVANVEGENDHSSDRRRRRRLRWYQHPAFWIPVVAILAGGVAIGVVVETRDEKYFLGAPQVR